MTRSCAPTWSDMATSTRCTRCDKGNVVELEMTAKNGQVMTMASCTRCETRTWTVDGAPVERDEVLRITSGDPDFEVTPSASTSRRGRSR
jgi:hypothetical protein